MTASLSEKQQLKAFINAAQYLAGLTTGQDIWEEAGKVLIEFFGADFVAFGRKRPDEGIEIGHRAFSRRSSSLRLSEPEMTTAAEDVFESGFLTFLSSPADDPAAAAFFPVYHENRVIAVMIVGHLSTASVAKEVLDLYLAIAGLIGATYSRKISESAVLQAKEDWERTFDAVPDMIALIDLEYRIVRANKAMAMRLGLTQEECVGLTCFSALHGSKEPPPYCPYTLVLADGMPHAVEMHEDRLCADFLMSNSPIRDKNGKLLGGVLVARDISERKRAERELELYRLHLEELVGERTSELAAANRELESFSYSVSHDLRAPLRSIDGFSQQILEDHYDRLDEDGRDAFQRIRAASQRMGLLIDGLLNLARFSRSEITHGRVDLGAMARHIAEDLRKSHPGRKAEFIITEGLIVDGDERLLYVVLQNLLGNAWKFCEKCDNTLIEFGATEHGGRTAYFVRDNGAGFDMAYASKLFSPFQRLHAVSEYPGTGIGLATVQRIIQRHGGQVWAEGEVGRGATFYFTFK